jgi:DNA-binding IclR family transcriptional regulator
MSAGGVSFPESRHLGRFHPRVARDAASYRRRIEDEISAPSILQLAPGAAALPAASGITMAKAQRTVESRRTTPTQQGAIAHTAAERISRTGRNMPKDRNLILTQPQAACLIALRDGNETQPKIAMEAKLALAKTSAVLRMLAQLGLAERGPTKRWHATRRGKASRFKTVPDRPRPNTGLPGPAGRRLLELLDRPMKGREIVEKLGMTHQGVRQLLIKLYAQGRVNFGDPENPFWIVMRAGDKTSLLSREEERVLSAVPREYATDASRIRIAARVLESKVGRLLEHLLVRRFVEASNGLGGTRLYRITNAGLSHPQCAHSTSLAPPPRLPVESERIHKVLSAIFDFGALRIIDVTNKLGVPRQSMNALMQYLKRKQLVKKNNRGLHSPYTLTSEALAALAEMARRQAA